MAAIRTALKASRARFVDAFPWVTAPFIIGAPMRVLTGADLALAVSKAGGLGFIGPGNKPEDTAKELAAVRELLSKAPANSLPTTFPSSGSLPVGIGFQLWNGDVDSAAKAVQEHKPCAVWLFAPRDGQKEVDRWTIRLREAFPGTQIWLQIGTVQESVDAVNSVHRPDALVVQGAEAGGHGRAKDGMGLMALFPEIADEIRSAGIPLFAAGGIADGRGVAAALALGATGVALGTRFLASSEVRINKGYQDEILRARDAAHNTIRTQLYNHLRGTFGWPEEFSPRGITNQSWFDHQNGVPFDELQKRHDEAAKTGPKGWGPEGRLATYAGAAVGLVHTVEPAAVLVSQLQTEAKEILQDLAGI
ncbi:hypothetical protein BGZ63DRAFT_387304 [Mariannaea sp. PMI_226]|nr:hypothetical protein BGZ63DRAFT_387304 [Mariannaea sp. PMI_226]